MNNIIRKQIVAGKAAAHIDDCERFYLDKIDESVKGTVMYGPDLDPVLQPVYKPHIGVVDTTTTDMIIAWTKEFREQKICALNFASYTNPGGGYVNGANAQEENLCADSFLYNVLSREDEFYEWNRSHLNGDMYEDRALYSPNIWFGVGQDAKEDDFGLADILTCAAPRIRKNTDRVMNERTLFNRIRFIKSIVAIHKPDVFIAGAWGCGVFRQNPKEVAEDFKVIFGEEAPVKEIIFAVPKSNKNKNYEAFKEVFR